jgi:hypothetical protein
MRIALVVLLLTVAAPASAQERVHLQRVDCEGQPRDDAALVRQLAIEGIAIVDGTTERVAHVEGPCDPALRVRVVVIDEVTQVRMEQEIALAGIPAHLRARLVATIASTLLDAAATLARAQASAPEVAPSPPPPEPPSPEARTEVPTVPPEPRAVPTLPPTLIAPAPTPWRFEAAAAGRLYVLGGLAWLVGARLGASFDRFVIEIAGYGTHVVVRDADVDAVLGTLALGLRMIDVTTEVLLLSFAVLLEGGVVSAGTHSHLARYVGRDVLAGVGSALARARLAIPLSTDVRVDVDVEIGATLGLELDVLAHSALYLSGPFVALACGVSWT